MKKPNLYRAYGSGNKINLEDLPILPELTDPRGYEPSKELENAVNVALLLQKPLLVTGKPGTGKSQLANSISFQLDLPLETFICKHNSIGQDTLYIYDSLQHFSDANRAKITDDFNEPSRESQSIPHTNEAFENKYIKYQALGKAIKRANNDQKRTVVLIDEIDKAPREFPNDLLEELDSFRFTVSELSKTYKANKKYQPIVVITSNQEKILPDAFLRRCVYHHIPFPKHHELMKIVEKRLGSSLKINKDGINSLIEHFIQIQELTLSKAPGTAELLSWLQLINIHIIQGEKFNPTNIASEISEGDRELLKMTYSVLVKYQEDLSELGKFLDNS